MVKHHVCLCLWLALALYPSKAANIRGTATFTGTSTESPTVETTSATYPTAGAAATFATTGTAATFATTGVAATFATTGAAATFATTGGATTYSTTEAAATVRAATTAPPSVAAQASTEKDASDSATAVTDANTLVSSAAAGERQEFDKVNEVSKLIARSKGVYASGRVVVDRARGCGYEN